MKSTRLVRRFKAPRERVYRAFVNAADVQRWMVPTDMTSTVHTFDAREGGSFRVTLTYDAPTGTGKTTAHSDTYHGRFVELVPHERIVETMEFETDDPAMRGTMTLTIELREAAAAEGGGTELVALHEGLPPGLPPADNELGWSLSLAKLAELVE